MHLARRSAWLARGAVLRAAEPRAVRRQGAGRARRSRSPAGVRRADARRTRSSTSRSLLAAACVDLLAAGLQVTGDAAARRWPSLGRSRRCWRRRRPRRSLRDAAVRRAAARRARVLYVRSGAAMKRLALCVLALLADVYWIRAIQYYGGTRLSHGGTTSATTCCTRCSTSRRRSIRGSTSPTASARSSWPRRYPGGAGRPDLGDRAAREGVRGQPAPLAVHAGHRVRPLLVASGLSRRPPSGSSGGRRCRARRGGCGRWPRDAGARAATARLARCCGRQLGRRAENEWLRHERERRPRAARRARPDRPAAGGRGRRSRRATAARVPAESLATLGAARPCAACRVDPSRRRPTSLDPATGAVTVSPASPLYPLPTGAAGRHEPQR